MKRLVTTLAIASVVLLGLIARNPALAQASGTALPLSNPLILKNPTTGAQVQIMPTTQYLAQHAPPYASTSTTSTSSLALPAPTCTLATDPSTGDAQALISGSEFQNDALDISAFGLSSDTTNLTGQISVQSLGDGSPAGTPAVPQVQGGGDIWYLLFNYGSDPSIKSYFLEAEYPGAPTDFGFTDNASTSNLPVDLSWGEVVSGPTGSFFQTEGPAGGSFDTTNNQITLTEPLTNLHSSVNATPTAGATLYSPNAIGDELLGSPGVGGFLETADTLDSQSTDYHVGQSGTNCPTLKSTGQGSAGLPAKGSTSNLAYYGGPVVHSIQNHIIWWLPHVGTTTYSDGSACTEPGTQTYSYEQPASGTATVGALPGGPDGDIDYTSIIQQYFKDLNGTAFYNLLTQYADQTTGATKNSEALAGTWTDNCGYTSTATPATPPAPGGTDAAPIYQIDIQNEVQKAIQVNKWPTGLGNQYFVYTGYGAADCFAPASPQSPVPACNTAGPVPTYCAYHGDFQDPSGSYVLYADMSDGAFAANPAGLNLCYSSPIGVNDPSHTVSNNQVTDPIADAEVSISSHEEFETVNDAEVGTATDYAPPLAWYDLANGEIGDKCAYNYGTYASDGSNITLHGDHYIVQQEYSNWNNGCALTSYQNNNAYGADTDAVTIQQGWNLIGVPASGITSASGLVSSMTAAGQLPAGSIQEVQIYVNGKYQTYIPGKGKSFSLTRTEGVLVESKNAGTWTPSGTVYTSAATIKLIKGWNLVATTWPNPGLDTDSIYNQIAAEAGACSFVGSAWGCNPTITDIAVNSTSSDSVTDATRPPLFDWKPTPNGVWPENYGDSIPFTSGMWIYSTKALTWAVQGNECQSVDSSGVCH